MSRHLKKILKLRQIFLEFDEDGSRKMELDEMEEMFHKNKLFVSTQELIDLFFKGQRISKNAVKTIPDDLKHSVLISKSSFVITISQDNIFKTSLKKRYHITKETNDSSTTIKSKVNNHSGMNSSLSNILSHKFMNIKGKNVLPKIYQSNSSIC